eukprot:TRINITY_DN19326_c0_g2_i1.p1 TRINITY_DN19326_c0_g2~~TRINITY_DN19326_c0_g2_i1.p1  ORF type:complete len:295 (+),score=49.02 TRINITY_DN19326_c0_g2_i1:181-1065(+)
MTQEQDAEFMRAALEAARQGRAEGGIPIGAALVMDGAVLSTGYNRRVQEGNPILHGETDCLQRAGRRTAAEYRGCTMYTTLSPCSMCTGTILLYKIPRVVIAENTTFMGGEDLLRAHGVEVVNMDLGEAKEMMAEFIAEHPSLWCEDIGELEEQREGACEEDKLLTRQGGCHCGAVRFEADLPERVVAWDCNCSICDMKQNTHVIVPGARFRLLCDPDALSVYTFGTHTAQHKFCKCCGVVSFYVPRSNPDGFGVTLRCIDQYQELGVEVRKYDGTDWESSHSTTGIGELSKVV